MSVRLYVGNLPTTFDVKELEALLATVGEGVRFKPVNDRDTGACRGFGFASVDSPSLAESVIEQLNGRSFGGNTLRVEISERRDARGAAAATDRRGSSTPSARKDTSKVVHSDSVDREAPDPRWASELARLKSMLANQKVGV
jgi:RNA recognition motif-containing protein